jgi:hypothetical protein
MRIVNLGRERAALSAESAYFLVTGVWPLLSYSSFEAVTGRKRDDWLVKTLGVLLVPIAVTIALGVRRPRPADEVRVLALGSALALGVCEVVFVARRRIRPVYLLDAAIEAALTLAILSGRRSDQRRGESRASSAQLHRPRAPRA